MTTCGHNLPCAALSPLYTFFPVSPNLPSASFDGSTVPNDDNDINSEHIYKRHRRNTGYCAVVPHACMENTQ